MKLIGSLEGTLAIINAAFVGWLLGLGGVEFLADHMRNLMVAVSGSFVNPEEATAWVYIASIPLLLPVGIFGLVIGSVYRVSWGMVALSWSWYAVNAILWGEILAFLFRLIQTGNLRHARDEMFRWTKYRPVRDPEAPPRKTRRQRRSRGLG